MNTGIRGVDGFEVNTIANICTNVGSYYYFTLMFRGKSMAVIFCCLVWQSGFFTIKKCSMCGKCGTFVTKIPTFRRSLFGANTAIKIWVPIRKREGVSYAKILREIIINIDK